MQRLRESGNVEYLNLARKAAEASLKAMPPAQNSGGLALMARIEFSSHDFGGARDLARQLLKSEKRRGYPLQILGDALLELGDYDEAAVALREAMKRDAADPGAAARLGREAYIRGRTEAAREYFAQAITLAAESVPPSRETEAWCRWQLGELEFNFGRYSEAEASYEQALVTFPDYYRGLAGLGRVKAALGDIKGAIAHYEKAIAIVPDPTFIASLGDLLEIDGRVEEANTQFALVEKIAKLGTAAGALYDRQLAGFYADHDRSPEIAYEIARKEYSKRHDIYGADALAWAALKTGRIQEARRFIEDAVRFKTQDARLYYHLAMIERADGNLVASRARLREALQISPQFDPRQAPLARKALSE